MTGLLLLYAAPVIVFSVRRLARIVAYRARRQRYAYRRMGTAYRRAPR